MPSCIASVRHVLLAGQSLAAETLFSSPQLRTRAQWLVIADSTTSQALRMRHHNWLRQAQVVLASRACVGHCPALRARGQQHSQCLPGRCWSVALIAGRLGLRLPNGCLRDFSGLSQRFVVTRQRGDMRNSHAERADGALLFPTMPWAGRALDLSLVH